MRFPPTDQTNMNNDARKFLFLEVFCFSLFKLEQDFFRESLSRSLASTISRSRSDHRNFLSKTIWGGEASKILIGIRNRVPNMINLNSRAQKCNNNTNSVGPLKKKNQVSHLKICREKMEKGEKRLSRQRHFLLSHWRGGERRLCRPPAGN